MILGYTASADDAGRKVYSVLRRELMLSSTAVKRLKQSGGIFLNGEPVFTTVKIAEGDRVSADIGLIEEDIAVTRERGDIEILREEPGWLAVNKPCGMLVHPSRARTEGTLLGIAAGYLEAKGESPACHVVNRLDRDTGGVVLIAKSAHHKAVLAETLHRDDAVKEYIAVACGALEPPCGTVDAPIARLDSQGMKRGVREDGQRAVTEYETLARGDGISVLRLRLLTGRTHQIRVHMSHLGSPLLGDALYGTEESRSLSEKLGIAAQALHAAKLTFRDPETGERVELSAPIRREDMKNVIKACGL